jgi:hypothetical protein
MAADGPDFINYGILPGVVLGVINYFFFFSYRYSPAVAPRIREIHSFYDSFILSFDSGLWEEIIFTLFILSCLIFTFRNLYARVKPLWPSVVAILPVAMAIVLSSLLFAMVHDVYAFTAAFFGGMLLGMIYLKGGIEGAIAAHFVANFVFFSALLLNASTLKSTRERFVMFPSTLGDLRNSPFGEPSYRNRTVKDEMRTNLIHKLEAAPAGLYGIIGYEDTVFRRS